MIALTISSLILFAWQPILVSNLVALAKRNDNACGAIVRNILDNNCSFFYVDSEVDFLDCTICILMMSSILSCST